MATLMSLPAEIRLSIVELLNPDDALRFAAVNKGMWQLCDSLITTHRIMVTEYRHFYADSDQKTVWKLFNDLSDDPRVADYVLVFQMSIVDNAFYDPKVRWHDPPVVGDWLKPDPLDVAKYIRAADDSFFLATPAIMEWEPYAGRNLSEIRTSEDLHKALEDGDTDPMMPLVLTRLHALQTLRLIPCHRAPWFTNALRVISAACADPVNNPGLNGLFQHLKTVQLSHWDTELCIAWESAVFFTRLPSLEYFSAHMIGGGMHRDEEDDADIPDYWKPALAPTSNLKTLLFSRSMISSEVVNVILSNCKALETFEYDAGGASISWDAEYDPRGFMSAIIQYCAHSIERLVLENDDCESIQDLDGSIRAVPCLNQLEKLKVLRCQYHDLVDNVWDDQSTAAFDPQMLFPRSLERLHLDQVGRYDDELKRPQLMDLLLESKISSFPNLTQVFLANESYTHGNLAARATEQGLEYAMVKRDEEGLFTADY
ncbi:hypothetical protein N0V90_011611 [Kalmusia sp. IMI 367209]|nr:hypothetical protein N0V90_011611 [Kalmusia sp. IMI 367209]